MIPGGDQLADWINEHPWTMLYIAVVVTLILVLEILEVIGVV